MQNHRKHPRKHYEVMFRVVAARLDSLLMILGVCGLEQAFLDIHKRLRSLGWSTQIVLWIIRSH